MKNFRTLYGKPIDNIVEYIKNYIESKDEHVDILIGCDSQSYKNKKTVYGVVIALHSGKGAHVLCYKESTPIERNTAVRLINETWKSIQVADMLRENGLPDPQWIDIDLNPDPKFDSNKTLRAAVGLVEGMGYKCRCKHNGVMATYAANHLVRS